LPAEFKPVSINASANVKDSGGNYFKASYRWGNLLAQGQPKQGGDA